LGGGGERGQKLFPLWEKKPRDKSIEIKETPGGGNVEEGREEKNGQKGSSWSWKGVKKGKRL